MIALELALWPIERAVEKAKFAQKWTMCPFIYFLCLYLFRLVPPMGYSLLVNF